MLWYLGNNALGRDTAVRLYVVIANVVVIVHHCFTDFA